MAFNMDDYEPVEVRIGRFYAEHAEGRILTDLIAYGDSGYIVKATVYRGGDDVPGATGYAQEQVTQRGVNATSALENCETSAIGRALANLGYATKGKRPSREEMAKSQRPAKPAASDEQIASWDDHIAAATTVAQLQELAAVMAQHDLGAAGAHLRDAYLAKNKELTPDAK